MEQIVVGTIQIFAEIISIILIVRMVLSFLPIQQDNKFTLFIMIMTEPYLALIRRFLDEKLHLNMMVDFSIIIAYFLVYIAESILITLARVIL